MSMPPILERMILQGLASYDTWTFGTAGAGTLRVPKDQFIILTDFDYFHFVDEPKPTVTRASATSVIDLLAPTDIVTIDYEFLSGGFDVVVTLNVNNITTTQQEFQAQLDSQVTGWLVDVNFEPAVANGRWFLSVSSPAPGTAYNTQSPTITPVEPVDSVTPGTFTGGSVGTITAAQVVKNAIHQLEFRQKGKVNSWVIAEDLELYFPGGGGFYGNVTGCYQKRGLYIPYYEDVQIGIIKVPHSDDWTSTSYTTLANKSNEPALPAGYGIAGAGIDVVASVTFAAAETYVPITEDRSAIATGYREQFKVDYADGRELTNPVPVPTPFQMTGNTRRYPIINFGFIRVNMDWKTFQNNVTQWTEKLER